MYKIFKIEAKKLSFLPELLSPFLIFLLAFVWLS